MKWTDKGGGDFTPAPLGTHLAYCVAVIDLGTQPSDIYKAARKTVITWELPDELDDEGRPFKVSAWYTQSLHERAKLREILTSWRGRDFTQQELEGFDPFNLLGKPCQVTIVAKQNSQKETKHVVSAVTGCTKRMLENAPRQVHESVFFSLDDYSAKVFAAFSDKMRETIQKSPEWQALNMPAPAQQVQSQPRSAQRQPEQARTVDGGFTKATDIEPETWAPDPIDDDIPF